MIIASDMDLTEKLKILSDAAKYDVACTSSGVTRKGNGYTMGSTLDCGICHTFAADGRCVSLLKILFTNECIFNCKYCINRSSNDVPRASFTPDEVCTLTMEFYRRNYIEGLFLSSGILKSPDYTMSLLYETVWKLRFKYGFNGYIHIKGIPGASQEIITYIGFLADRMSVNLELPTAEGLQKLAPHKNRHNILTPMRHIQNGIKEFKHTYAHIGTTMSPANVMDKFGFNEIDDLKGNAVMTSRDNFSVSNYGHTFGKRFVPAGQSTQMIIGATPESDYQLITVAESLYKKFDLKRVFYSAFVDINKDSDMPFAKEGPPLLREHRLYQADWLMRYYGFASHELLNEQRPNFNIALDPKCDWALQHLDKFPVEINKADYYTLLRVPGIGVKSAQRIVKARRQRALDFDALKKMGVVLKRAVYFITCQGKMMYTFKFNEDFITRQLVDNEKLSNLRIEQDITYKQLSLFDDMADITIGTGV
ncbi:MAG: putative DNA modification/repair radical SAM protein [Eubacterium sp.]